MIEKEGEGLLIELEKLCLVSQKNLPYKNTKDKNIENIEGVSGNQLKGRQSPGKPFIPRLNEQIS